MSKVTISHVFFTPKSAYINFQHKDSPDVFYNVAIASRKRYIWGDQPGQYMVESIPDDEFRSKLAVGNQVDISWSKKANAYFVQL